MQRILVSGAVILMPLALPGLVMAQGFSTNYNSAWPPYCTHDEDCLLPVDWHDDQSGISTASERLWAEFDARPLSASEKRFLQAALALRGYYNGLIDGAWGRGSQSALEQFTRENFDREPSNSDAAYLTITAIEAFFEDGWEPVHMDYLAISLMLPTKKMRMVDQDGLQQEWEHTEKDVTVIFNDLTREELVSFHRGFSNFDNQRGTPYTVRRPNRWVTSIIVDSGTAYVRSELIGGTWSTVVILGAAAHVSEVGLISSSIKVGQASNILPPVDGLLISLADELTFFLNEDTEVDQQRQGAGGFGVSQAPQKEERDDQATQSSGTGFFVNSDGAMLTNAHVIQGCSTVTVDGMVADIVSISQAFDLAAIKPAVASDVSYLPFASAEAGLNADITIAGYPLYGLLGGLNVSRGSISSMTGLGGDETSVQISAPVQPGNSGGPVIDRGGNVVGVVVSKLDVMEVANLTGDIAQNVNFAIRGSMAKIFLQANGIIFETRDTDEDVRPEQAAQVLQAATRLIQCVTN